MCGIHGFNWSDESLIKKMILLSNKRGPDGNNYYLGKDISLGHNLLSIIDKKNKSIQPWYTQNKKGILVYNGEIYNFQDIKNKLIVEKKIFFRSNTDTEVVAEAINHYGPEIIKEFDGMFALAYYDSSSNHLFLIRDKFGIKPFYYFLNDGVLIFSSDINSILAHEIEKTINYEAVAIYFDLGYVPGSKTHYKFINKLEPGELIKLNLNNNSFSSINYNSTKEYFIKKKHTPEEFRERFKESVFETSIGIRNKGMYLSGGLDSSTVLYELNKILKIDTFSTKFDSNENKFNDDLFIAKQFSKDLNLKHSHVEVTEDNFVNAIENIVNCLEIPICNQNLPAYYLTAKFLSDNGKTITFSGDGGDETFSGYPRHIIWLQCLILLKNDVE